MDSQATEEVRHPKVAASPAGLLGGESVGRRMETTWMDKGTSMVGTRRW